MIIRLAQFGFLLLIFSLGFMQPTLYLSITGRRIIFTDVIFPFVLAMWSLGLIFKKTVFRRSRFYLPLAFYLLALACAAVFSADFKLSPIKFFSEIYLIGLAVLSFNLIDTFEKLKRVFLVWLVAVGIAALTSLLTFALFYVDRNNWLLGYTLSIYGTLPPGNYPRIQSTFENPNMLCNYFSVGFPMLLAAIKLRWINSPTALILLLLLSIACIFTLSPSLGGIGLIAGLWLSVIFREKKKIYYARLSFTGGIFFALLVFLSTLATPIQTETSPFYFKIPLIGKRLDPSSRVLAWNSSLQTLRENPIFGKGVGADVADARYLDPSGRFEILNDAHQMWLNVAGQAGFVGLFALCFLCLFLFRRARVFSFADEKSIVRTALGIGFISAFLYQGLTGSYEDARHLWILIGLLASASEGDFPKIPKNG